MWRNETFASNGVASDLANFNDNRELIALVWSDELAYSASEYINQNSGCNTYLNNLLDDGIEHEHLEKIAYFEDHERLIFYPEHFAW